MVAVDICNLALSYLGDPATVSSIDPPDGSVQAQHCARFYPMALSLMLEAHSWNFATRRVALALVASTLPVSLWQYAYTRPADAVTILSLIPGDWYTGFAGWRYSREPLPFELDDPGRWRDFHIESDLTGRQLILSNLVQPVARYTSSAVQANAFPALFTDALAWKLASMLAGPLLKGDVGAAESKRCLQVSMGFASQAMSQDANQQRDAPRPQPVWMRDR